MKKKIIIFLVYKLKSRKKIGIWKENIFKINLNAFLKKLYENNSLL